MIILNIRGSEVVMGKLIDLSAHFEKRRQMIGSLPQLVEIFMQNFPLLVRDQAKLQYFVKDLLQDPQMPVIELDDNTVLALKYKLQTLVSLGPGVFSQALSFSLLHMEHSLKLCFDDNPTLKKHCKAESIDRRRARIIAGMLSLAWQIATEQDLVIDAKSMQERHANK